jgi:hypothetical protein
MPRAEGGVRVNPGLRLKLRPGSCRSALGKPARRVRHKPPPRATGSCFSHSAKGTVVAIATSSIGSVIKMMSRKNANSSRSGLSSDSIAPGWQKKGRGSMVAMQAPWVNSLISLTPDPFSSWYETRHSASLRTFNDERTPKSANS